MSPRAVAVLAMFLGPVACAADQLVSYMLVYPAATGAGMLWLHLVTVAAAAVASVGIYLSFRVLRRRTAVFEVDRFLAVVGIALNAFFLLVVLFGFGLPKLMMHPTD